METVGEGEGQGIIVQEVVFLDSGGQTAGFSTPGSQGSPSSGLDSVREGSPGGRTPTVISGVSSWPFRGSGGGASIQIPPRASAMKAKVTNLTVRTLLACQKKAVRRWTRVRCTWRGEWYAISLPVYPVREGATDNRICERIPRISNGGGARTRSAIMAVIAKERKRMFVFANVFVRTRSGFARFSSHQKKTERWPGRRSPLAWAQ